MKSTVSNIFGNAIAHRGQITALTANILLTLVWSLSGNARFLNKCCYIFVSSEVPRHFLWPLSEDDEHYLAEAEEDPTDEGKINKYGCITDRFYSRCIAADIGN